MARGTRRAPLRCLRRRRTSLETQPFGSQGPHERGPHRVSAQEPIRAPVDPAGTRSILRFVAADISDGRRQALQTIDGAERWL